MAKEITPADIEELSELLMEQFDTRLKSVVDAQFLSEKLQVHINERLSQNFSTVRNDLITEIRGRIETDVTRASGDIQSHYNYLKKAATYFGVAAGALFVFLSIQEFSAIPDKIDGAVSTAIAGKGEEIIRLQSAVETRLELVKQSQQKSQERTEAVQTALEELTNNTKKQLAQIMETIEDKRTEVAKLAAAVVEVITKQRDGSLTIIGDASKTAVREINDTEKAVIKEIDDKKGLVIDNIQDKSRSAEQIDNQINILRAKTLSATEVVGQLLDSGTSLLNDAIEKGREIRKKRDGIFSLALETETQASGLTKKLDRTVNDADRQLTEKLVDFEKRFERTVQKYRDSLDDRVSAMGSMAAELIARLSVTARLKIDDEIRRETGKFREAISQQSLMDALELVKETSVQIALEKRVLKNISKYRPDDRITILTHFVETRFRTSAKRQMAPLVASVLKNTQPEDFSPDQWDKLSRFRLRLALKFDMPEINKEINDSLSIASTDTALEELFDLLEHASGTTGDKPRALSEAVVAKFSVALSSIATQHDSGKIRIRAASYLVGALRGGSIFGEWDESAATKWIADFSKRDGATSEGSLIVLRAIPELPKNKSVLASLVRNLSTAKDVAMQQNLAESIFDYLRELVRKSEQDDATVNEVIATIRPHMLDDENEIDRFIDLRENLQIYLQSPVIRIDSRQIIRLIDGKSLDINSKFTGTPYQITKLEFRETPIGSILIGTLRHDSGDEAQFSFNVDEGDEEELLISEKPIELVGKISMGLRADRDSEDEERISFYLRRF